MKEKIKSRYYKPNTKKENFKKIALRTKTMQQSQISELKILIIMDRETNLLEEIVRETFHKIAET